MSARIAVTPEGREDVWLADRASLKAYIEAQEFEAIHNFLDTGPMLIGADHSVVSVLADIDAADRVGILTGSAAAGNLGHALALVLPCAGGSERLAMYDIGPIGESDLEIAS